MTLDAIKVRAQQFDRANRRTWALTGALFLLILIVEAWQVWRGNNILERTGDLLQIAALVYCAYQFRDYYAVEPKAATLGVTASVDFYRRQLARQHELASRPWRYLVAFVPGVTLSLFSRALDRPFAQNLAIAAFGVALFLGVAWVNMRTARKLRREVDSLG